MAPYQKTKLCLRFSPSLALGAAEQQRALFEEGLAETKWQRRGQVSEGGMEAKVVGLGRRELPNLSLFSRAL